MKKRRTGKSIPNDKTVPIIQIFVCRIAAFCSQLEGTWPPCLWRALWFLHLNMGVTAISKIHSKTLNAK